MKNAFLVLALFAITPVFADTAVPMKPINNLWDYHNLNSNIKSILEMTPKTVTNYNESGMEATIEVYGIATTEEAAINTVNGDAQVIINQTTDDYVLDKKTTLSFDKKSRTVIEISENYTEDDEWTSTTETTFSKEGCPIREKLKLLYKNPEQQKRNQNMLSVSKCDKYGVVLSKIYEKNKLTSTVILKNTTTPSGIKVTISEDGGKPRYEIYNQKGLLVADKLPAWDTNIFRKYRYDDKGNWITETLYDDDALQNKNGETERSITYWK